MSTRATLSLAKHEAVEEATHATQQLIASRRWLAASELEHESLTRVHSATLRSSAASLITASSVHLDSAAYEAIRDIRLCNTLPKRTALICRCACVLLAAAEVPPEPSLSNAPGPTAGASGPAPRENAKTVNHMVKRSMELMNARDDQLLDVLARRDLSLVIGQCQLERLLSCVEVVTFVATQADFATADGGAARAPSLSALLQPSGTRGARKRAARPRVTATAVPKAAWAAAALMRRRAKRIRQEPGVGAGQTPGKSLMRYDEAMASTTAAGHLFLWIARVIASVCELADLERCVRPEILATQEIFDSARREVTRLAVEEARKQGIATAATDAFQRHVAEEMLKERMKTAHERLRGENTSLSEATVGAGGHGSMAPPVSTGTSRTASAASSASSSPTLVQNYQEPDDAEEVTRGFDERLAREVTEWHRANSQRLNALYHRVLQEGGELLAS